jgi:hypothetical protein
MMEQIHSLNRSHFNGEFFTMIHSRYLAQWISHQLAVGVTHDGGPGSGNFGHTGRLGETGGSYSHAQVVSAEHHVTDLPVLHGGWRANPLYNASIKMIDPNRFSDAGVLHAPEKDVPLSEIVSPQKDVYTDRVLMLVHGDWALHPADEPRQEYPMVVKDPASGKYILVDGNHRAVTAWALGEKSLHVRVLRRGHTLDSDDGWWYV